MNMDSLMRLFGLIIDCPFPKSVSTCPFLNVRNKPVIERLSWLKSKSLIEIQMIEQEHLVCFLRREVELKHHTCMNYRE
jgi:hypothetical protein